ncbi:MAG: ParB N-terminal domain-containing protein [Alphaproteobacteria bacterium]
MTASPASTVPLNELVKWKGNVRKTAGSKEGINELVASIAANGLLHPLIGFKKEKKIHVVDGGRRLEALGILAARGDIANDHPVRVEACAEDKATEISLTANAVRENMHPADEFDAFKAMVDKGEKASEIAARFGQTEKYVLQRLKLANVAPVILQAYRDEEIDIEVVMAYAITNDHKAQEKFWKSTSKWQRDNSHIVTRHFTKSEIQGDDRRVQFVTLKAYQDAGGKTRGDLFAENDDDVFISDKELLTKLVSEKLEKAAARVKAEGWSRVEIREQHEYSEWSKYKQVDQPGGKKKYAPAILEKGFAVVSIGYEGKTEIHRGYILPKDLPKGKSLEKKKKKAPLSAALVTTLTSHRTAGLAAELLLRPDIALAAVVYTMALRIVYDEKYYERSSCLKIDASDQLPAEVEDTRQAKTIVISQALWKKKIGSKANLWDWCLAQKQATLLDLLAFCAGPTIDAVQNRPDSSPTASSRHANQLAVALKLDMTKYFTPTAENYFGKVSKDLQLKALKEGKRQVTPAHINAKRKALAGMAERELKGTGWLPELLRAPQSKKPDKAKIRKAKK